MFNQVLFESGFLHEVSEILRNIEEDSEKTLREGEKQNIGRCKVLEKNRQENIKTHKITFGYFVGFIVTNL